MSLLHTQITDYITERIDSGEWPVGYMLPTEMQLCEKFGVSRSTARTAVMKLVNDGHLQRIKGKGTFVTKPRHLQNSTVFIESFSESKTGKKVKSEVLELRECEPDETIRRLLGTEGTAIKLTRLRYWDGSFGSGPIVLTTSYLPAKFDFILKCDFEKNYLHTALESHDIIRYTISKELFPVQLTTRQRLLLGMPEGTLGMLVQSVDRDAEDRIVCVTQSYYPEKRNHFELKFSL